MTRNNSRTNNENTNTNNATAETTATTSKKINYQNRIVLDFSKDEIDTIKEIMSKEHIPFKKTMVYIMIKRYMDEFEEEKQRKHHEIQE